MDQNSCLSNYTCLYLAVIYSAGDRIPRVVSSVPFHCKGTRDTVFIDQIYDFLTEDI